MKSNFEIARTPQRFDLGLGSSALNFFGESFLLTSFSRLDFPRCKKMTSRFSKANNPCEAMTALGLTARANELIFLLAAHRFS